MVNPTRLSLATLGLVAWAGVALAVPLREPKSRPTACDARSQRPPRFEIRHDEDGRPGPRTSPDGRLTVKVVSALEAVVVDTVSGRPAGPVLRHSPRRDGVLLHTWAFSPDGRLLATASSEGQGEDTVGEVRVWEVASGKRLAVATDSQYDLGRVSTVAFSEDGKVVVIHCQEMSGK